MPTKKTSSKPPVLLDDLYAGIPATRAVIGGHAVSAPDLRVGVPQSDMEQDRRIREAPPAFKNGGPLSAPGVVEALAAYRAAISEAREAISALREARATPTLHDSRATQTERDVVIAEKVRPAEDAERAARRALDRARRAAVAAIWDVPDDLVEARRVAYLDALQTADVEAREAVARLEVALSIREQAFTLSGSPGRGESNRVRSMGGSFAHWSANRDTTEWDALNRVGYIVRMFPTPEQRKASDRKDDE